MTCTPLRAPLRLRPCPVADASRPILLSLEPTPDGQLVAVWSVRPGRRVQMLIEWSSATPDGLALIADTILPTIDREDAHHE